MKKTESALQFRGLIRILKRRKWEILLPAVGIFLVTILVGLFVSPMPDFPLKIMNLQEKDPAGKFKFIKGEGNKAQTESAELDAKIDEFKAKSHSAFTDPANLSLKKPDHGNQTLDPLNQRLRTLKEKERNLQKQLAGAVPAAASRDRERLDELLKTYVKLRFSYSEIHPDMIKVKREIAALEKRQAATNGKTEESVKKTLMTSLAATQSDIQRVQKQIHQARNHSDNNRERTEQSKPLSIRRDHLQANQFTIIKPYPSPEKPEPQSVSAVLLMGLILGIGTGLITAVARELFDKSAYTVEDLASATELTVLAAIPEIVTRTDRKRP